MHVFHPEPFLIASKHWLLTPIWLSPQTVEYLCICGSIKSLHKNSILCIHMYRMYNYGDRFLNIVDMYMFPLSVILSLVSRCLTARTTQNRHNNNSFALIFNKIKNGKYILESCNTVIYLKSKDLPQNNQFCFYFLARGFLIKIGVRHLGCMKW